MKRIHARFGLVLGLVGSGLLSAGSANAQSAAKAPSAPGYYIQDVTPATPAIPATSVAAPTASVADPAESVYTDCGCADAAPVASSCSSGGCSTGGCSTGGCSSGGCQLGSRLGGRSLLGGGLLSDCESPLCRIGNLFPRYNCELGDPWTLFGNCGRGQCGEEPAVNIGGWIQLGAYSDNNDLFFDGQDDQVNLHQAWLFAEKVAQPGDNGELGFGYRFDILYGTDADDTQSFGNSQDAFGNPRGFDNSPGFNRGGGYGWAIPQAYLEVAKNDWSAKVGHFYTLAGYEVVGATGNFFFSHAITQFNSEPFTHTGAVATYNASDNLTLYGGWTAGWDTGFDQFGNGSTFLGGFSSSLSEDVSLTYITTFGDLGARGDDAYHHSVVLDTTLTERVNWVVAHDLLRVDSTGEDNISLVNYLFYTCNDRLSFGTRNEWWKGDAVTGYTPFGSSFPAGSGSASYYETTVGLNYRINGNTVIRPEFRYDYSPALDFEQETVAMDVVVTF